VTTAQRAVPGHHHATRHYGKYRGKVAANVDPQKRGRVQVSCPAVLNEGKLAWAMPSSPFAGAGVGLFLVPPVGANVWVEFEAGDIDYPIVTGCFWGKDESPSSTGKAEVKMLKTDGMTLTIDDTPGALKVTLEVAAAAAKLTITLDDNGIVLANGTSNTVAVASDSVSINDGALKVV
jgi:uncharacterized protein involved in type VI secretion and phage assembly